MRSSDLVQQLARYLPALVDDFTTNITIDTLASAAGVATATTSAAHGLAVGNQVRVAGAETPISCSITRSGIVGTMVTDSDHDMTENAGFSVVVEGATETEFNGTFELLSVPNRRTIRFKIADSGPTLATGAPLLLSGSSPLQSYNGLVEVTGVPSATSFEYSVPSGIYSPAAGTPVAKTLPRIAASADLERAIQAYTKQSNGDAWGFVVLGDAVANKAREEDTDATSNYRTGQAFRAKLIQAVDLYVMFSTAAEIAGRPSRDRCEELLQPICQCLLRAKFPSLLSDGQNSLQITGHGLERYDSARYVHRFAFESILYLSDSDTFIPDDDVAFRDISLTIDPGVGSGVLTAEIDLDEDPLP